MSREITPIAILLLDDDPRASFMDDGNLFPQVIGSYRDAGFDPSHFDVRWLATPGEAREFRDLSQAIAMKNPAVLGEEGWVPDILVVDYALTTSLGTRRTVAQRLAHRSELIDGTSALVLVKRLATRLDIELTHDGAEFGGVSKESVSKEQENFGCFLGGLLLTAFREHPVGLVASTVRQAPQVAGTYTDFFQWALQQESEGSLREGTKYESWMPMLQAGVRRFRDRVVALAKAGVVDVSLDDLRALIKCKSHPLLSVSSRFGRRHYPVQGLFIDGAKKPHEWAEQLLKELLPHESEFTQGERLAQDIWRGYGNKEAQERRWRLAALLLKEREHRLQDDEAIELQQQKGEAGWKRTEDRNGKVTEELTNPEWIAEIRMGHYSKEARRWAALLLTWRLMHRMSKIADRNYGRSRMDELEQRDVYHLLFPLPYGPAVLPWIEPGVSVSERWTNGMLISKCGLNIDELRTLRVEPWERRVLKSWGLRFDATGGPEPESGIAAPKEEV